MNKIYCMDCLEGMKQLEDNSVDLVLTDPPYGIGADKGFTAKLGSSPNNTRIYEDNWDNKTPNKEVFDEILRIGKKVIIFGGNYFLDKLPFKTSWIVWDKVGNMKQFSFLSDVELAWTNFDRNISKKYTVIQKGFIAEERDRIHPTQKPVKLFRNIIKDYSEEGDLICDPFMGSGTTAVACKQLNCNFIGFEISQEYVNIANKRLEQDNLTNFFGGDF